MWQSLTQLHIPLCRDAIRLAIILPVNLARLNFVLPELSEDPGPDLAPLTRLTQLVELDLGGILDSEELPQPLPRLPALLYLRVWTESLQMVSSVAMTLQELDLYADNMDFRPLNTLACFTRLQTLSLVAETIRNFNPEELPPSLGSMTITCEGRNHSVVADQLTLPAGGHTVKSKKLAIQECSQDNTRHQIAITRWTRHSPDEPAVPSRRDPDVRHEYYIRGD